MWKILVYSRFEDVRIASCKEIMFDDYDEAIECVTYLTSWGLVVVFGQE